MMRAISPSIFLKHTSCIKLCTPFNISRSIKISPSAATAKNAIRKPPVCAPVTVFSTVSKKRWVMKTETPWESP
jgi:hypothetical protein